MPHHTWPDEDRLLFAEPSASDLIAKLVEEERKRKMLERKVRDREAKATKR